MNEVELCQKSLDEDNIGCYYCLLWPGLLLGILHYVLYSSKGTFNSKHEVSGYYFSDIEIKQTFYFVLDIFG